MQTILKGRLLKGVPYKISHNSAKSICCTINELSGLIVGDKVYQEITDEGIILLIPEKVWIERENNLKKS